MFARSFLLLICAVSLVAYAEETYSPSKMCGGRLSSWRAPSAGIGELATLQPVTVTREGRIRWNGQQINDATFDHYLRLSKELNPRPQMILRVEDGADCKRVNKVRASMDQILECKADRACGEGTGWRRWPGAKPEA
jgi:hypothetical protein